MKKIYRIFYPVVMCTVCALISCAALSSNQSRTGTVPDWVLRTPESDSRYEYFTASADGTGSGQAEERASANLLTEVSRYVGAAIRSSATVTVSGELEVLEKHIQNELRQTSQANIELFKVTEKYFVQNGNSVTAYLLGRYDKVALAREMERLETLLREKREVVTLPEQTGDSLFAEKEYFLAAKKFLTAAVRAETSDLDNANVYVSRTTGKSRESIERIELTVTQADKNPHVLCIQSSAKTLPIRISYFVRSGSRKKLVTDKAVLSSGAYDFPLPANMAEKTVYVYIDDEPLFAPFADNAPAYTQTVSELKKLIATKQKKCAVAQVFVQSPSITVNVDRTSQFALSFLQALQAKLLKAGYRIVQENGDYTISATLACGTPEADSSVFFAPYTVRFSVYRNGTLVQSEIVKKTSVGFSADEALQASPETAAAAIVSALRWE